ncbi:hypothetical protein GIB67_008724, partial [Kingdonia uniflora]
MCLIERRRDWAETGKTLAIVVGEAAAVRFGVILFMFIRSVMKKHAALLCKIAALRSFMDKLIYRRERASGMSSLAYFLSKDTIDHLNTLIKPLFISPCFTSS